MIKGGNPTTSRQANVVEFYGQFTGRGASNGACPPVTRADGGQLCKELTFTRTAAGRYTLALPSGVPNILGAYAQVRSNTPNPAQVQPMVYNAAAGTVTFAIKTPSTAADYDPTNAETIDVFLAVANTVVP